MSEKEEKRSSKKAESNFVANSKELDGVPDLSMLVYLEMPHVTQRTKKVLLLFHYYYVQKVININYHIFFVLFIYFQKKQVAVNPYERLPIYGQDVIDEFHEASKQGKLPQGRPHPYGVSARSYMRLVQRRCNQSIIVCGESGAGKVCFVYLFFF
ncbi:myosin II heavy chain Myo3, partial [Reticulomyxa filosa]